MGKDGPTGGSAAIVGELPPHCALKLNWLIGWASDDKKELDAVGRLLKSFDLSGLLVGEFGDDSEVSSPGTREVASMMTDLPCVTSHRFWLRLAGSGFAGVDARDDFALSRR